MSNRSPSGNHGPGTGTVDEEHGTTPAPKQAGGPAEVDSGSQRQRALAEEISNGFGFRLKETALVLYDRDPTYLHAQWYVTPQDLGRAREAFAGSGEGLRQVLRWCRMDRDGKAELLASTKGELGDRNLRGEQGLELGDTLPDGGYGYRCELGLESADGGWVLITRSNQIGIAHPDPPVPGIEAHRPFGEARDAHGEVPWTPNLDPKDSEEPALADPDGPLYPMLPDPAPLEPFRRQALAHRNADPLSMPPPLLPSTRNVDGRPRTSATIYDPRSALSSATVLGSRSPRGNPQRRPKPSDGCPGGDGEPELE